MTIPGSHLEKLYHLRNRINDEIRIEEAKAGIGGGQSGKKTTARKVRAGAPVATPEKRAAAAGVSTKQVRAWAYTQGLMVPGRPGRLSHAVLDRFLAHRADLAAAHRDEGVAS